MIIAIRDGKRYEITDADQWIIMRLMICNGGDIDAAIAAFHKIKFGEDFAKANHDKPA